MSSERREWSRGALAAGFAVVVASFGALLLFDTHDRDAFSWMDPYQYYEFALGVLNGAERFDRFEIPSLFPFLVMPFLAVEQSIPAALWVNVAALALLVASVFLLCRELRLATPAPLVAALVLSSPLLLGLSRSLYVEFTLCGLVSLCMFLWLRLCRAPSWTSGAAFGLVFALGFMTKMTFLLFTLPAFAPRLIGCVIDRREREAGALVAAVGLPLAVAIGVQLTVFGASIGYYTSFGNTSLPVMFLIGPTEWLSWASGVFYLRELGRTLLFLLAPFLGLAVWVAWRWRGEASRADLGGPGALLWLWLLAPLVLLIAQPVKEPRHVAPCVVPAVLLLVSAIERLSRPAWRRALLGAALGVAGVQLWLVARGGVEVPYLLRGPLHVAAIQQRMEEASAADPSRSPPAARRLHWKYDQNVAIAGFPGNEALALVWQLFPSVVFDLDTLEDPERISDEIPYRRFEDLYLLSAFNTYNRRCGWRRYYGTLSRAEVLSHADFLIVSDASPGVAQRFPSHEPIATIERDGRPIHLLRTRASETTPYRVLYARAFLARRPRLDPEEVHVVATELLMATALAGEDQHARDLVREFPVLGRGVAPARNIYWIGGYETVAELARRRAQGAIGEGAR